MNILATLFNLAGPDLIVNLLIVLLMFGSKKLPELAKGMGQAVKEFNKAKDEIERELTKTTEVAIQPAAGQQPRQPAELPTAAPVIAAAPVPQVPPATEFSQPAPAVQEAHPEEVHPAGQA